MSAPRIKRQFAGAASDPAQRQITSFFTAPANTPSSPSTSLTTTTTTTQQYADKLSHLPATVQANLLSVGMRVRKSVPEGYKTGDCNNAFALWDEGDANPDVEIMGEGQRSRANAFSSPRELLPFCGLHKVGGFETQPDMHTSSSPARVTPATYQRGFGLGGGVPDIDEMPGLTSSQESVESNASSDMALPPGRPSSARKRFFVEDDEDEFSAELNQWRYAYNSGLGARNNNNNNNNYNNGRAMAVPSKGRLRRAKFPGSGPPAATGTGQENMMVIDSDFEEAGFLDQGAWEMEMEDA
ncbi:ribonucleotide reductase inhibitor-domain-containing protein [Nemania sp. FL0916]|nr:ribonucleotide reductase inhibitor-domain-containing protein [Nemania sp. FL0916]